MTEEQVTKAILNSLIIKDWKILTYDFPQSGSGKILHSNEISSKKNKGGIVPDIVAIKDNICLFFENKDRVDINDFQKVFSLISNNQYSNAISTLLKDYNIKQIYYGIGFPSEKWNQQAATNVSLVDFVIGVSDDKHIEFLYNLHKLTI